MKGVILISGNGSNLQAIIDQANSINLSIKCVISNQANAFGLQRAKSANIATQIITSQDIKPEVFDSQLMQAIDVYQPDIVILAGFMRILTAGFTQHYLGKLLNIHPSLLPKFKGLNTHQRVINSGDKIHGASVHFVTDILDSGAIIAQSQVPVNQADTADTLVDKVLEQEHKLYPVVINWFTSKRLYFKDGQAYFDNQIITNPITYRA